MRSNMTAGMPTPGWSRARRPAWTKGQSKSTLFAYRLGSKAAFAKRAGQRSRRPSRQETIVEIAKSKPVDETKLQEFVGQLFTDLGGTMTAAMVLIGDKLGLYKAMADGQPVTSAELARKTNTVERY